MLNILLRLSAFITIPVLFFSCIFLLFALFNIIVHPEKKFLIEHQEMLYISIFFISLFIINILGTLILDMIESVFAPNKISEQTKNRKWDARSVEPLINVLTDESSYSREAAAIALGEINDLRALKPLINALKRKDEEYNTRVAIIEALGKIKDLSSIEPLINVMKENGNIPYGIVASALKNITCKNFGKKPEKWEEWWQKNKDHFTKSRQT